ncbi:MAG: hypothetical protein M3O46_18540, partial [Myxococcota bacterium]|nr:hypothetical protein [Myxococcota bacterium]
MSPAIVHRGLVLSSLVLVERLLVPTTTWAFFQRDSPAKVAFAFALGLIFAGRTFAQYAFKARTEADLLERLVSHLVDGDVLRANVFSDADARAELPHAVYLSTQVVAVDLPLLVADGVATALLTILIVSSEPGRLAGFAIATTSIAALALIATRRAMQRAINRAWEAQQRVYDCFVDALEGRLDVVASGRRGAFLAETHARAGAWAKAGSRVAGEALLSNKLPLLVIAALAAAGAAVLGPGWRGSL